MAHTLQLAVKNDFRVWEHHNRWEKNRQPRGGLTSGIPPTTAGLYSESISLAFTKNRPEK